MKYIEDLTKENGHKIVKYNETKNNYEYKSVFDYSVENGGTYNSHKYYNDYVIEVGGTNENN